MLRWLLYFLAILIFPVASYGNVSGSDLHNFNPTPNGLDFVTVHSTDTLQPLEFNFGVFFTYATNSLPYSALNNPGPQKFGEPNDKLLYSDIHLAAGIFQGFDIGVAASFTNSQDIDNSTFLFTYGDAGINDVRVFSKIRIVKTNTLGIALLTGVDFDQIHNNPFIGDNAGPSVNMEVAFDLYLTPKLRWAMNGGYRLRNEGASIPNTGITPMPDQFVYSGALSYKLGSPGSAIMAEMYGSYPTEVFTTPTDRQLSNLEAILGYRWRMAAPIDLHVGAGSELYNGLGSPDFRVYAGFNWRFLTPGGTESTRDYSPPETNTQTQDNDDDGDGVPNPIDQCEGTLPGKVVDERGCAAASIASDSDGDGVVDKDDQCPNTVDGTRVNQFGCEIKDFDDNDGLDQGEL
ncbi:MAG: hypothetical protein KDD33_03475 [Bdellovibrionales bacterium]|nr:hypothetical protein [Bdellovibrionales bacterium]